MVQFSLMCVYFGLRLYNKYAPFGGSNPPRPLNQKPFRNEWSRSWSERFSIYLLSILFFLFMKRKPYILKRSKEWKNYTTGQMKGCICHDRPLNGMRIKSGLVGEFDSLP